MKMKRTVIPESGIKEHINIRSHWSSKALNSILENAKAADIDLDVVARFAAKKCKFCYYMRSKVIAGAAMTTANCEFCDKEMHFSSTNTNRICNECSDKHRACVYCSGDLNL